MIEKKALDRLANGIEPLVVLQEFLTILGYYKLGDALVGKLANDKCHNQSHEEQVACNRSS